MQKFFVGARRVNNSLEIEKFFANESSIETKPSPIYTMGDRLYQLAHTRYHVHGESEIKKYHYIWRGIPPAIKTELLKLMKIHKQCRYTSIRWTVSETEYDVNGLLELIYKRTFPEKSYISLSPHHQGLPLVVKQWLGIGRTDELRIPNYVFESFFPEVAIPPSYYYKHATLTDLNNEYSFEFLSQVIEKLL